MIHSEGSFKGVRNAGIYYQSWLPDGDVITVLLIVHGLGEHSGRYMNVVNHFVPLGYAVYGFDHIGHGRSEGKREVIESFTDFTETLTKYFEKVKDIHNGKPIFLLGHSMGGLIVSHYLLDYQKSFNGAIISAPLVKVSDTISKTTIFMGKLLSVVAPQLGLLSLDVKAISRDPEVVKKYVDDPLVYHSKTPARLAAELLKAMLHVTANADKITLPFIVIQGCSDTLVDPAGAQMLYDRARSADKSIKIYDGLYHEVFNEPEHTQVLKDVETWIAARI
jgi:acylglycerol lipase